MIFCSAHISSNPIKSAHKMPFTKLMSINKSKSFASSRECCVENTPPVVHLCGTSNALYQCEINLHPKFSCFGSNFTHSTPETGRFLITYGFSAANFYLCVWLIYCVRSIRSSNQFAHWWPKASSLVTACTYTQFDWWTTSFAARWETDEILGKLGAHQRNRHTSSPAPFFLSLYCDMLRAFAWHAINNSVDMIHYN